MWETQVSTFFFLQVLFSQNNSQNSENSPPKINQSRRQRGRKLLSCFGPYCFEKMAQIRQISKKKKFPDRQIFMLSSSR